MRRREFIRLFGSAALGWPLVARAQKTVMPIIGFLHSGSPGPYADALTAFRQGLTESGYSEG
jgi:putative tryptophan/tyrosine transport system substrate-binding protein